ncbi:hypothetical protein ACO0K7_09620 [Undibacterium sp. Ji67W]|uniref:hypothetical protein n=1 Tax=Undibacterium sp. Ji67W TaxID=3413042 RepID=UPI003BF049D9
MNRLLLKTITIDGVEIERLPVFCDDNGGVIVLALLWSLNLTMTGSNLKWRQIDANWGTKFNLKVSGLTAAQELVESNIEANTLQNYAGHLYRFLCHINLVSRLNPQYSLNKLEQVDHKFVNNCINFVLPYELSTYSALNAHVPASACAPLTTLPIVVQPSPPAASNLPPIVLRHDSGWQLSLPADMQTTWLGQLLNQLV